MNSAVTYPIYYVDKCPRVALSETVNNIGRLPGREDCLDEGREFILGNSAIDQASQASPLCLLAGVDSDGWIGGIVRVPYRVETR